MFRRFASEAEIAERMRISVAELTRPESARRAKQLPKNPALDPDLLSYLKIIRENPGIPATARDDRCGIRRKKGVSLRKKLIDLGLLESFNAPGARGANFTDLRVTDKGLAFL